MKQTKAIKIITWITGILTILLGFYALARPMKTFLAIGWILGILFLVNGIELAILSLSKEKKEIGACILGVIEGLAGVVLLFSGLFRFFTDIMVTYLVGGSILLYGILQVVEGVKNFKLSKGKAVLAIICGVLSVIVSIVVISHPILTMFSVGYIIAFSVLMQGFNMIVLALNIGKMDKVEG
ncbi:MAG: HdeD family acid-resistance protein [Roseburia sp.]